MPPTGFPGIDNNSSSPSTGLAAGLLKNLVGSPENGDLTVDVVASAVAAIAGHFAAVAPTEFAVASVARRVCAIIREEAARLAPVGSDAAAPVDSLEGGILAARAKAIKALAADAALGSAALVPTPSNSAVSPPFRAIQEVRPSSSRSHPHSSPLQLLPRAQGVVDGVAELQDEIDALGSRYAACCGLSRPSPAVGYAHPRRIRPRAASRRRCSTSSPPATSSSRTGTRAPSSACSYTPRGCGGGRECSSIPSGRAMAARLQKARVEAYVTEGGPSLSGHSAALQLATPPTSSKVRAR